MSFNVRQLIMSQLVGGPLDGLDVLNAETFTSLVVPWNDRLAVYVRRISTNYFDYVGEMPS